MDDFSDFASLLEGAAGSGRQHIRLEAGQIVEATVLEISHEWIFVDVGTPKDGRIERHEFKEQLPKKGDRLRLTVLDPTRDGPRLTMALGQGGANVDVSTLELAQQGGTPVHGEVVRAVKGGLEVKIGDLVAFCPASQVELGYASDLGIYVGQAHDFKVLEIRDGGRSVVLSRRALLQDDVRKKESELLTTLKPGADITGTITSIQRHGALVDLGGATGFIHISEVAAHRVERVEDVLKEGEQVAVRVLSIEPGDKGLRIRLSLKQLTAQAVEPPKREEILEGTVSRVLNHGVLVDTEKGSGLVPLKELGLPPGADHRRAYPPGRQFKVVLLNRDSKDGKLRFSAVGVAGVEERRNYKEFSQTQPHSQKGLGSLGDVFRQKLGLSEAGHEAVTNESPAAAAPAPRQKQHASTPAAPDRSDALGVVRRSKS